LQADLAMNVRGGPTVAIQILFVQGGGEVGTHDEWDNKLVDSLTEDLGLDYEVRYPLMPNEADPSYPAWKTALEKELASLDDGAILIGHSIGGTILINALAERAPKCALGAIILIAAPFVGHGGWTSEDIASRPDLAARLPIGVPVFLYHGTKDETVAVEHIDLYAKAIPGAHVRRLNGRDHQLNNSLSEVAADILQMPARTKRDR
jgi:predicted alpha/beta hydrolase family esterase